jgi:oligoendopeptidase F
MAWFDPELLALPEETLDGYLASPDLAEYRHYLDDIVRNRPHTRSPEVEEILAMSFDVARGPRDTFMALDNADLVYGTVRDEEGAEVELTKGRYQVLLDSKNREVRRGAYEIFLDAYVAHRNTLASLHATSVRKDVFYARARGFETARESALFANAISEQVYDSLIEATRAARPTYERYNALRRRMLGIDTLEAYDMFVPIAPIPERRYTYAEAVELVLASLAPLGEEYVSALRGGLTTERWVDLPETKGKRSGAYSWGAYRANPVILMNWNGTLDHVYTLTHEAGHAMHSYLADRAQPYHDAQYPIFLAEVASTLNEDLLTRHLLGTTRS